MIIENLEQSKEISHNIRRLDRKNKMADLDVEATIPSLSEVAEANRQVIRDENAAIQNEIDDATTPEKLKEIINPLLS